VYRSRLLIPSSVASCAAVLKGHFHKIATLGPETHENVGADLPEAAAPGSMLRKSSFQRKTFETSVLPNNLQTVRDDTAKANFLGLFGPFLVFRICFLLFSEPSERSDLLLKVSIRLRGLVPQVSLSFTVAFYPLQQIRVTEANAALR
jgi:hypothetical protein